MEFKAPNNNEGGKKTAGLDERIGSLFQPDTLIGEDYAANLVRNREMRVRIAFRVDRTRSAISRSE